MTISKLIEKLEAAKAKHGDLSVQVVDGEGYYGFGVMVDADFAAIEAAEAAGEVMADAGPVLYLDITCEPE